MNTLSDMQNNSAIKRMLRTLDWGETGAGVSGTQYLTSAISDRADTIQSHVLTNVLDKLNISSMQHLSDSDFKNGKRTISNYAMVDGADQYRGQKTTRQELGEVLQYSREVLGNAAKEIGGEGLALGALGVGAAIMVSGFVGGNPSAPAQNQAQGQAEDQYYTVPSLGDSGAAAQPRGQQGYVININARSDKGQKRIQEIMHEAMTKSTTTDVNISLNINQNQGNIDNRTLENILARVF